MYTHNVNNGFPIPQKDHYKVYVRTITYNQAPYIEDTLNGVAIQQTNFPFVQHIVDDCSTDGEQEVIKSWMNHVCDMEHAEYFENDISTITIVENKKNPNHTIVAYFLKKNLFYEEVKKVELYTLWRKVCPYEAFCEGDDYWTDPLKLQKQVDFMESHLDCSICFHHCSTLIQQTQELIQPNYLISLPDTPIEFTAKNFFKRDIPGGQPLTMMYRYSCYDVNWCKLYSGFRDTHIIYLLLKAGKGFVLNFNGGVYRKHSGGVSSGATKLDVCGTYNDELELYKYNHEDPVLVQYVLTSLLWVLDTYWNNRMWKEYSKVQRNIARTSVYLFILVNFKRTERKIKQIFKIK